MDKNVKFKKENLKLGTMILMDRKYENNKISMKRIYKRCIANIKGYEENESKA